MGVIKAAIGDVVLTSMWVFCASTLGGVTSALSSFLGVQGLATLLVTTTIVYVLVLIFTVLGDALGGASFNPTGTLSFYAAGIGADDLLSMAIRVPAQAFGGVCGAAAIREVVPAHYKHILEGPFLKVDTHTGAIVEGILTFVMSLAVLVIVFKGPRSPFLKLWLLAMVTISLVVVGSGYTGPAMNPANAFGWAYLSNSHNTWEHFYVYWIFPFAGAILSGWVFRSLFPPAKEKKA